ncbi:hypothetical protein K7432_016204 [Basidiobolus ranarum]|uniref:Ras modification protein ERF4 n=1 Tax=Basidiobolus ranarum TaxID=34480 RepID=A0ABR2VM15_9FUNG
MNLHPPTNSKRNQLSSSASTTNYLLSHSPSSYYSVSPTTSTSSSYTLSTPTPQRPRSQVSNLIQPISPVTSSISAQFAQTDPTISSVEKVALQSSSNSDSSFLKLSEKRQPEQIPAQTSDGNNTKENSPPRLNLRRISTDFTATVFSRLSYALGENSGLSDEDHVDSLEPSAPEPLPTSSQGIIRIERDYSKGELCQFSLIYPTELNGKISPESFRKSIVKINDILYTAESSWLRNSVDNFISCLTLYTSPLCFGTFYQKCINRLHDTVDSENSNLYLPAGLHLRDPRRTAFLFLEIEILE